MRSSGRGVAPVSRRSRRPAIRTAGSDSGARTTASSWRSSPTAPAPSESNTGNWCSTSSRLRRSTTATGDSLPHAGESVQVDEYPHPVTTVPPVYPKRARQDGIEGTVVVEVLVGRDGRVHDARILKSIPILDDAAVAAVRQWIFRPAQSKGQPVAVWVAAPVKFTLQ